MMDFPQENVDDSSSDELSVSVDDQLLDKCSIETAEDFIPALEEMFSAIRDVTDRFVHEAQKFSDTLMHVVAFFANGENE